MIPFEAYSEEQRSRIVECLNSVIEKNTNIATWTSDGERLTPTAPGTTQQLNVGETYHVLTEEQHFNTVVDDLEVYARCYEADINRECAVSAKQLKQVASLCARLVYALSSFSPHPHLLGLGVNREQRSVDGEVFFAWDLTDSKSFLNAGADSKKGKDELLALVEKLRSIENAVKNGIFFVGPSASKRWRNEYLRKVLNRWLDAGGVIGGPNNAMVDFFRAVCALVLGKNYPTDGALVKWAYDQEGEKGTKRRFKQLKLSKIKS